MPAHRIGEGDVEEIIVARGEALDDLRQRQPFFARQRGQRAQWRRGSTIVSNGQHAQNGTSATKCSLAHTMRSPARSSSAR